MTFDDSVRGTDEGLVGASTAGIKVSDAEMAALDITGDDFHAEWNYTIRPRKPPDS